MSSQDEFLSKGTEALDEVMKAGRVDADMTLKRFSNNVGLLTRFIKKYPTDATMKNLKEAVEEKRYKDIEIHAHTAKGNSANLGFQDLSDSCAKMVSAIREGMLEQTDGIFAEIWDKYQAIIQAIEKLE